MARKKSKKPTELKQNPKLQAIKVAMSQIKKEYGEGAIMKLGDDYKEKIDKIPTGSIALDLALGIGGIPRGRITEIYGPEASGKTTLCLHIIAEAQKKGGVAAFIDAEHALDPKRAKEIGVDVDNLLISQPDTGEQALEIAETLIRSGGLAVVVIDSVAALVPKAEIEAEMGDSIIGLQARLMSQAMRKLSGAISKSKTSVIFTNQIRMKIGIMFGNPETTSGGKALKFYASVRLDCRKRGNIKDGENIIGSLHRIKVVKNKVAPPFREAQVEILNKGGISKTAELVTLAVENEFLGKSGSFYKYKNKVIAQGKEAMRIYLEENPKLANKFEKQILQKAHLLKEKENSN